MANTIKIKRGSNANLPSLNEAELAFTTDTRQLYAGTASGNKELFKDIPFPTGGLTGELLVKKSDADYDAEWQDLLGKVAYKRRIMVGDNLDNVIVYADFPNEYVNEFSNETTNKDTDIVVFDNNYAPIKEKIEYLADDGVTVTIDDDHSNFGDAFYVGNILFGNMINNTELTCGGGSGHTVNSVENENKSYRHLFIEDPNIRPIKVGDILEQGTRLYFVFPDNFITWNKLSQYIDTDTQSSVTIVSSATGIYDMGLDVTSNPETLSTRANPGAHSVIRFYVKEDGLNTIAYTPQTIGTETTYKNKSTYLYVNAPTTSQTSNEITSINPDFNQYILVDKRTLGGGAEESEGIVSQEGISDGYYPVMTNDNFNSEDYTVSFVAEAVDNYASQDNYTLEDMLYTLGVDTSNEIISLQGNNINISNYEISRGFEIYVTEGVERYLDPYGEGLVSDDNGHFIMRIKDLINKNTQDYLLMIISPNYGDTYFYQIDEVDTSKGDCLIEFNVFPDYQIAGPYFLLKKK